MIRRYFMTHMKMLYTDKFTLVVTVLSMVLFFLFVNGMSELIMANEVVIALDVKSESNVADKIFKKLKTDSQVRVIRSDMSDSMAMIEGGQVDIFITLDEGIDEKIARGEYKDLIQFYSGGISLYSVLYPEMIFGTIVEDIHLSVVDRYVRSLYNEEKTFLDEGSAGKVKEIYESVYTEREDDYFFKVTLLENAFIKEMKDITAQKLFYLRRIVGVIVMLLNLYIMVIMVKSVEEYEFGVRGRMAITPVGNGSLLLGQWLVGFIPSVLISLMSSLILVSYRASVLSGLQIFGALVLVSALLVVIMMIVAHLVKETHKYILISVLMILGFSMTSGIFFEIDIIPGGEGLRALSPYSRAIDHIVKSLINARNLL